MQSGQSVEAQLAVLVEQVAVLRRDLAELRTEYEGPPWERSVRARLHVIEAESSAARIAARTLDEARRERRRAEAAILQAKRANKLGKWRLIAAATALAVAVYPYLAHFAGWGS